MSDKVGETGAETERNAYGKIIQTFRKLNMFAKMA